MCKKIMKRSGQQKKTSLARCDSDVRHNRPKSTSYAVYDIKGDIVGPALHIKPTKRYALSHFSKEPKVMKKTQVQTYRKITCLI